MTESAIIERLGSLTAAVQLLAQVSGARLTRAELAARLGIHRNTLADQVKQPGFPKPKSDGKWLLADVSPAGLTG